jgi:hypothetical protein
LADAVPPTGFSRNPSSDSTFADALIPYGQWFPSKDPSIFHPIDASQHMDNNVLVLAVDPSELSVVQQSGEWPLSGLSHRGSDFDHLSPSQYASDVDRHMENMTLYDDSMMVPYPTEVYPYTPVSTSFLSGPYVSTSDVLHEPSVQFPTYELAPSPASPSVGREQLASATISHPFAIDTLNNPNPSLTDTSPALDPSQSGNLDPTSSTTRIVKRNVTSPAMDQAANARRTRSATHQCPHCPKKLTTKAGLKSSFSFFKTFCV